VAAVRSVVDASRRLFAAGGAQPGSQSVLKPGRRVGIAN
jgi:hypothetical protein